MAGQIDGGHSRVTPRGGSHSRGGADIERVETDRRAAVDDHIDLPRGIHREWTVNRVIHVHQEQILHRSQVDRDAAIVPGPSAENDPVVFAAVDVVPANGPGISVNISLRGEKPVIEDGRARLFIVGPGTGDRRACGIGVGIDKPSVRQLLRAGLTCQKRHHAQHLR